MSAIKDCSLMLYDIDVNILFYNFIFFLKLYFFNFITLFNIHEIAKISTKTYWNF